MYVGEVVEMCFNVDNVIIPYGFLECDGSIITEDEYPELFMHLCTDFDTTEINLPFIKDKKCGNLYIIKKLICFIERNETKEKPKFDSEFNLKLNKDGYVQKIDNAIEDTKNDKSKKLKRVTWRPNK